MTERPSGPLPAGLRPLARSFYERSALEVAPALLNKVLVRGARRGRIVEVEAYLGQGADPGSHAQRGETPRNASMFGPPGHLYVYFTYGMHWCANAVCSPRGTASAVLLRAVVPIAGVDEMEALRPRARRPADLTNGPAKLCQAFGISAADDGADLAQPATDGATIVDDGVPPPPVPHVTARVGLSSGVEHPWRYLVPGTPTAGGQRHRSTNRRTPGPTAQ